MRDANALLFSLQELINEWIAMSYGMYSEVDPVVRGMLLQKYEDATELDRIVQSFKEDMEVEEDV